MFGGGTMKIRILFRVIQEVPVANREQQKAFEHRSDLHALRLGLPVAERYRPFTGNCNSLTRITEREFESIAEFCHLMQTWYDDPECQKLDAEWERCYNWERHEILYADDPRDPVIPWLQMAAEQGRTIKFVVNPNYKMPKDQPQYKG